MKKIKSVLCILLALSLVFAFGVTAFAQASTE